jgi:hypothetical protein
MLPSLRLSHGSSPLSSSAATSQACKIWKSLKRDHRNKKLLLRVTNVIAHGPGIKLLNGLAKAPME